LITAAKGTAWKKYVRKKDKSESKLDEFDEDE